MTFDMQDIITSLSATDISLTLPTNTDGIKLKSRAIETIRGVSVHQSFTEGTIEEIAQYHTGPNHHTMDGFERTPYHLGITREGNVLFLNDFTVSSPIDQGTIMVLLQGCFPFGKEIEYFGEPCTPPSLIQLDKVNSVWYTIKDRIGFTNKQLFGHYMFGNPNCPGNDVKRLIETIRNV
jgi:hypothetical protein